MVTAAGSESAALGGDKGAGPGEAVERRFRGLARRGTLWDFLPGRKFQPRGVRGPDGGDAGSGFEPLRGAAGGDERLGAGGNGARHAGERREFLRSERQQEGAEEIQEEEAAAHLVLILNFNCVQVDLVKLYRLSSFNFAL